MELTNFTGRFERGEAFVRAKFALADTTGLSVHIKFTKARGRDVNGYYRWNDQRMVLAVKQRLRYPRRAAYGIGTTACTSRGLSGRPFRVVWHEDEFASADDLLVFVAGHEFWHFLCHSGQRKRDHETKANCNGFAWLREFRAWTGAECAVEEIPLVPPKPQTNALPAWAARVVQSTAALAQGARGVQTPTPSVQLALSTLFGMAAAPSATRAASATKPTATAPRGAWPLRRHTTAIVDAAKQLLLFR